MTINGYKLKSELQNANSGFSKWAFAEKNGKEYFVKELINPVFPVDRASMTEEAFNGRREFCYEYERKCARFFSAINNASSGNLVRIVEFFRKDSRYYIINEKVDSISMTMEQISQLPEYQKLLLLKTAAACFRDLHAGGIVHFDVKPNNIMIKRTKNGNYTAKLIDFDSGFFMGEYLEPDELGGDLTYLAPETFLAMYGENIQPDEKSDIFALGLVFHEYYCGMLPYFDTNEYEYPYESILDKGTLGLNKARMPDGLFYLIASMLNSDPKNRPSAQEIVTRIDDIMGISAEYSKVQQIGIHFAAPCGRSITLSENRIQYRNTADNAPGTSLPEQYFAPGESQLHPEQFRIIAQRLREAGIFNILKPYEEKAPAPGMIYQTLIIMCDGGKVFEYSTLGEPSPYFRRIAAILSEYCDFPVMGPLGVERRGSILTPQGQVNVNTGVYNAPNGYAPNGYNPGAYANPGTYNAPAGNSYPGRPPVKGTDRFKRAGDL